MIILGSKLSPLSLGFPHAFFKTQTTLFDFLFLRACYFRSIPKHKSPKVEQRSANVNRSPKKTQNKQKLVSRATVALILQNRYVGSGVGPVREQSFLFPTFFIHFMLVSVDLLHTHRFRHRRGYHRVRWARGVLIPSP